LKILDFGLARIVDQSQDAGQRGGHRFSAGKGWNTLPGVVLGTPADMAPEQINGQRVSAAELRVRRCCSISLPAFCCSPTT
jgi:serine/threonine protein kinase